jgi:DNA-binding GntR family transcriptional regulator
MSEAESVEGSRATDIAYARLTRSIINLELEPGRLINGRELAARLGVTRLTLVPALHRLAETGLISVLPRRGVQVAPANITDVQRVFDARLTLEVGMADMAARRASADQVEPIRDLSMEIDRERDHPAGYEAFLERDRRLHMAIGELSRNQFLISALDRALNVNLRLWHLFFRERGDAGKYFLSHREIVEALMAGDASRARVAVADHIMGSKELLQSGLWDSYQAPRGPA